MKKIIIIAVCLFLIKTNASKAQVTDTLAYLQQIVANKSSYIGKPFSALENDLKIQIKNFSPMAGIFTDITKETSTSIWFIKPVTMADYSAERLIIYWQPYLDHKAAMSLFQQNKGVWVSEVDAFYSTGIIKDITVLYFSQTKREFTHN